MNADTSLLTLRLAGFESSLFGVLGFEAVESIGRPLSMRVIAVSRERGLEFEDVIGQPLALRIDARDSQEIRGVVTEYHEEPFGDLLSRYEFHVQGRTAPLAHGSQCRVFLGKTAPEIIRQVLEESGVDAAHLRLATTKPHPRLDMHVQYNETNLEFCQRTAEAAGIFLFECEEGEDSIVVVADGNDAFPDAPLAAPLVYRPDLGMEQADDTGIYRVRLSRAMHPGKVQVGSYEHDTPGSIPRGNADGPGQSPWSRFDTGLRDNARTSDLARTWRESLTLARERLTATTATPLLRAGTKFAIRTDGSPGHPGFPGDYLVVEVHHHGSQEGGILGTGNPSSYTNNIVAQPASLPFRMLPGTPRPRVSGVLLAKVDGEQGSYAHLDDQGRYRARLPFDESSTAAGAATPPVRLAQPYAGPGYGLHAPLHVGNDLVLAFEDGDIDRPIALGALPNPANTSPVTSQNRSESRWRTASGNDLVLDDLEGKTRVRLVSCGQRELLLDDDPDTARARLSTPDGAMLLLDDKNRLVELSLAGGSHMLRIAEQGEGKAQATLSTQTGHMLQLDDEAKLLGIQSAKGHFVRIDDDKDIITVSDAKGKHVLQIDIAGGKILLKTEGDIEFKAKGNFQLEAAAIKLQSKSGAIDLKAAQALNLQGANANLKADQKLALQSGLDAGIKAGMNLKLEGSVNVESKAGVANKMTGTMTNVESSALNTIKGAMVMIN